MFIVNNYEVKLILRTNDEIKNIGDLDKVLADGNYLSMKLVSLEKTGSEDYDAEEREK